MKKITLWLTLGLLVINPLKPASADNPYDDDDQNEESNEQQNLDALEAVVAADIANDITATAAQIEKDTEIIDSQPIPVNPQSHSNNRIAIACEICGQKYNKKSMAAHMRLHTSKKPFKCSQCDYSSANSSNVIVHERRHMAKSENQSLRLRPVHLNKMKK